MIEKILTWFFPNKCPYCRKQLRAGMTECDDCRSQFPAMPKRVMTTAGIICTAPFAYEAKVRDSILLYKFKGITFHSRSYAKAVCSAIEYCHIQNDFDIVTFVPLTKQRKNERGFNQSELVGKLVADYFHKPAAALLKKIKHNKNQHDLGLSERILNVQGVYAPVDIQAVKGRKILLLDDIATTGNTLSECCKVLKESGAESIVCMSVAISGTV